MEHARVSESIANQNGLEVYLLEGRPSRSRWAFQLLVAGPDGPGDVRKLQEFRVGMAKCQSTHVCTCVALSADVERLLRVFREARQEELKERIDILSRDRASANGGPVGEAGVDGLIEELQCC
jgi:hypothetical protein